MAPLTNQHGVAVLEVRNYECRVWVDQDGVASLRAVGKTDHVVAQRERARLSRRGRGPDLKWPAACRVL